MAEALGWPFATKEIGYGPLARLPNWLLGRSRLGLTPAARAVLVPPWPALVIAAGRRSLPVVRWLKRRQPATFLVQLMWPGSARGLDLIAVPAHDRRPERPQLIRTQGVPHRITAARLTEAAAALAPRLADLPRPWIACLVGGSNRRVPFTRADAAALGRQANALARARAGSLLITSSRRTDARWLPALLAALEGPRLVHRWTPRTSDMSREGSSEDRPETVDNPYLGLLGAADAIIVTAEFGLDVHGGLRDRQACVPVPSGRRGVDPAREAAGRARRRELSASARQRLAGAPPAAAEPGHGGRRCDPGEACATDQRSRRAGGGAAAFEFLNSRDRT